MSVMPETLARHQAVAQEIREKQAKFIERVKREEENAKRNPKGYETKVRLLAMLGYVYIFGILSMLVLVVGVIIAFVISSHRANAGVIKILILLVPIIWAILRSLMVRLPAPDGVSVSRSDAPALWGDLDAISAKLKAPPIHKIVVDENLNAAASQVPRFGMFGPTRNTLILGLPLLHTVTRDEARAIIAHELGHFSGNHSRFGGKIYRQNITWQLLQAHLASSGGNWLFSTFFNWFSPLFEATTFVLRRQNEYAADDAAREVAGKEEIARGLMRLSYTPGMIQERFWAPLLKRVRTEPLPPADLLAPVAEIGRGPFETDFIREKLEADLKVPTEYDDTHPSLRDRLAALGIEPDRDRDRWVAELAAPVMVSAAEAFFGAALPAITARVNAAWVEEAKPRWAEAHASHVGSAKALAELRTRAETMPLNEAETIQLAHLIWNVEPAEEVIPQLRPIVAAYPNRAEVRFWLGSSLLELNDEEGIEHLERARALEPESSMMVLKEIAEYRGRQGDREAVRKLQDAALDIAAEGHVYDEQASNIDLNDTFFESDFGPEDRESLRQQLAARKDVARAYLVRKKIPTHPDRPKTVLIVARKHSFTVDTEDAQQMLLEKLFKEVTFPGEMMVFVVDKVKPWEKKMEGVPGALVFELKG